MVGSPQIPHGGDIRNVGIGRVERDATDVTALREPRMGPCGAPVVAAIDAVAPGRALAVGALAGADPDRGRVDLMHGDGAHGVRAFALEHGRQGDAVVCRLEDAAGGRRYVELGRIGLDDGQVHDPPAHDRRADVAEAQAVELGGGEGLGGWGWRGRCGRPGGCLGGAMAGRDAGQDRDCRGDAGKNQGESGGEGGSGCDRAERCRGAMGRRAMG